MDRNLAGVSTVHLTTKWPVNNARLSLMVTDYSGYRATVKLLARRNAKRKTHSVLDRQTPF